MNSTYLKRLVLLTVIAVSLTAASQSYLKQTSADPLQHNFALPIPFTSLGLESPCHSTAQYFDIESLDQLSQNNADVKPHIEKAAPMVGVLRWKNGNNTPKIFMTRNQREEQLNGKPWCTAFLIDQSHIMTAAHCFDFGGLSAENEQEITGNIHYQDQIKIPLKKLVKLVEIDFQFKVNPSTGQSVDGKKHETSELVENGYRVHGKLDPSLDYIIIKLASPIRDKHPKLFWKKLTNDTTKKPVFIIQHPHGDPKVVALGSATTNHDLGKIAYSNVDTDNGASGSPIYDNRGRVIAIHLNGGCRPQEHFFNKGKTLRFFALNSCAAGPSKSYFSHVGNTNICSIFP